MRPRISIVFPQESDTTLSLATPISTPSNMSNSSKAVQKSNRNHEIGFQLSDDRQYKTAVLNGQYSFFSENGYSGYLAGSSTRPATGSLFSIEFNGAAPSNLYLTFDTATGEYAKSIRVTANGKAVTISDNKKVKVIIDISSLQLSSRDTLQLELTNWSVLGRSVKIENIAIAPDLSYIGSQIVDFKCSENLMDSDLSLSPGVCEQYADVTIYDKDDTIHQMALQGLLSQDEQVSIEAVNDATGRVYALGKYLVSEWDVKAINSHVGITCRDKTYLFSQIDIPRADIQRRTIDDLLNTLFNYAGVQWNYLDTETQTRCSSIVIPNSWYAKSDLLTLLNKICVLGMLRMYWSLDTFYVGRCA